MSNMNVLKVRQSECKPYDMNANNTQSKWGRYAVGVGAVALSFPAAASESAYNVAAIVTNLGQAVVAAATIGVAWLGFTAGIAIWRNLRAAAK